MKYSDSRRLILLPNDVFERSEVDPYKITQNGRKSASEYTYVRVH